MQIWLPRNSAELLEKWILHTIFWIMAVIFIKSFDYSIFEKVSKILLNCCTLLPDMFISYYMLIKIDNFIILIYAYRHAMVIFLTFHPICSCITNSSKFLLLKNSFPITVLEIPLSNAFSGRISLLFKKTKLLKVKLCRFTIRFSLKHSWKNVLPI